MPKSIEFALPQNQILPPISRILMGLAVTVARWELNLRTRNALEKLDDHLLHDIGLDRARAQEEWDKPFWWN
ncbi:DUF1127 domain-containing protein [Tabrizicola oligotrophica]|nr:DUF1127 domain-containing protein [Tabrizicola oligotrophica]